MRFRSVFMIPLFGFLLFSHGGIRAQSRPIPATEPIPPNPIRIDGTCLRVGGDPVFLVAGELDYFAVPRKQWKSRMSAMKSAGINCLWISMPWRLHEPEPGRFDFGSKKDEVRDVEGFLKAAKEKDLYVIVRPGPMIGPELKYSGLPDWIAEKKPDLRSKTRAGADRGPGSASIVHPSYIESASAWMEQAGRVIARHTLAQGGPVAFVQLDGPSPGIPDRYEDADFNSAALGFGKKDGRYPHFLWTRYQTIDKVNYEYGGQYTSFQQVRPPDPDGGSDEFERRRRRDFIQFTLENGAEYLQTLSKALRAAGVEVPLTCIAGGPGSGGLLSTAADRMGVKSLLPAADHGSLFSGADAGADAGGAGAFRSLADAFVSLEILRLMGAPPAAFGMPVFAGPPSAARGRSLAQIAAGLKGLAYSSCAEGSMPAGLAPETAAPAAGRTLIDASGKPAPAANALKEVHSFLRKNAWLAEAERDADCRIAYDFDAAAGALFWGGRGRSAFTAGEADGFLRNGMLPALWRAGWSPVFVKLNSDDWTADTSTPVIVLSSSAMSLANQLRLADFMKRGGRLLIAPVLPSTDERFNPCADLAGFLGASAVQTLKTKEAVFRFAGDSGIPAGGLYWTRTVPAGAEAIATEEPSGKTVAWRKKTAGGGEAVFLGVSWEDAGADAESGRIRVTGSLLESLGGKRVLNLSAPGLWAAALRSGKRGMIFVYNPSSFPVADAEVRYQPEASGKPVYSGKLTLKPGEMKTIEVRY
ncbi:MAG: beta-galactosidase [bacterium]|nr:beta-galactosidase [bacterium]